MSSAVSSRMPKSVGLCGLGAAMWPAGKVVRTSLRSLRGEEDMTEQLPDRSDCGKTLARERP